MSDRLYRIRMEKHFLLAADLSYLSDRLDGTDLVICVHDRDECGLIRDRSFYFLRTDEAVFVGDRLYTDIAMGANAGIDSICVLSGEATEADIEASEVEPTWVMGGVADILAVLSGNPA